MTRLRDLIPARENCLNNRQAFLLPRMRRSGHLRLWPHHKPARKGNGSAPLATRPSAGMTAEEENAGAEAARASVSILTPGADTGDPAARLSGNMAAEGASARAVAVRSAICEHNCEINRCKSCCGSSICLRAQAPKKRIHELLWIASMHAEFAKAVALRTAAGSAICEHNRTRICKHIRTRR